MTLKIDKILKFFENATKADMILTIIVTAIIVVVIIEIFLIGKTVRKTYKMQKMEFKIIEEEFARINPNQYVTSYSKKSNNDNSTEQKMDSL